MRFRIRTMMIALVVFGLVSELVVAVPAKISWRTRYSRMHDSSCSVVIAGSRRSSEGAGC